MVDGQWSMVGGPSSGKRQPSLDIHSPFTIDHSTLRPIERIARLLLRRYGVVFRDLLTRESLAGAWRDLLVVYRKLELKGDVRGGRFVSGFVGEQFAVPEAVEALRAARRRGTAAGGGEIKLSACDPLNLAGVVLPGPRVPSVPTNFLILKDGVIVRTILGRDRGDSAVAVVEQMGRIG